MRPGINLIIRRAASPKQIPSFDFVTPLKGNYSVPDFSPTEVSHSHKRALTGRGMGTDDEGCQRAPITVGNDVWLFKVACVGINILVPRTYDDAVRNLLGAFAGIIGDVTLHPR